MANYSIEFNIAESQEVTGKITSNMDVIELFNQLNPSNEVSFYEIEFTEDIFNEIIFYNEYNFNFRKCTLNSVVFFKFKGNKIEFARCDFGKNVFINSAINSQIRFYETSAASIYFEDFINTEIIIQNCEISLINLEYCLCPSIIMRGDNKINNLELNRCDIKKFELYNCKLNELNIDLSKIELIQIGNCVGDKLIILDDSDSEFSELMDVHLVECDYNMIKLNGDTVRNSLMRDIMIVNTSNIEISNVNLNSLSIHDGALKNIRIISAEINRFIILNVYFTEKVEFIFVSVFRVFGASGANLYGLFVTTPFFNIPKELIFEETYIIGMKIGEYVDFPKEKITNSKNMNSLDKISFFRQFSLLLYENNHHFLSKKYRAIQFNLQLKYFRSDGFTDWIILFLNMITNNHGINPRRPLMIYVIFIFGFTYTLFYFHSIPDISYTSFLISNLSFLLNPIFDDNEIFNLQDTKRYPVYKFAYKVIYSYIVYQFIAAFRVFNK